jgi:ubiquinone/menaquinone biosynthesis C-methylase UbiE
MKEQTEINRGYVDHLRTLNQMQISAAGTRTLPSWLSFRRYVSLFRIKQASIILALLATWAVLEVWLRLVLLTKGSKVAHLNQAAINNVHKFLEQYPFHLYPIVCKAFELACLEAQIPTLLEESRSTVEVAIGDGTLSARVFPAQARVIGLDLSPYSLKKASEKPHVKQAIVCDCLNPPVREGSFDLLIANNFLHHVTNKENTLSRWARIAKKAVFNENSPTWASGWPVPYVLARLGRQTKAAAAATEIERDSLQSLEEKSRLDIYVKQQYEIVECHSYMSERTFFYCGLFSFIMRCYGPPTPPIVKGLFLSKLRWLVLPLTENIAKLLIRYDQYQDRSTDSFISYLCESKTFQQSLDENCLSCANCRGALNQSNECEKCGRQYTAVDGMLFLLPKELSDLQHEYSFEMSAHTLKEHL